MEFKDKLKSSVSILYASIVIVLLLSSVLLTTTGQAFNPPNGILFWLLALFICAIIGGQISDFLRAPPLLGMLIAGFVLRNTTSMEIDANVSAILRNIALTVILLRAGFGLDPKALAKLSVICFRLSFIPCIIETIVAALMTHFILGLPWMWGFLSGFVIAAVSPAVIIPGLISLSERRYGTDKGVPTLIIAAASLDDVLAITGFSVILGIIFSHKTSFVWQMVKGPAEAIVGLLIGVALGIFLWAIPREEEHAIKSLFPFTVNQRRLLLFVLFGLSIVFMSRHFDWSGVGPLASLTLSFVATLHWRKHGHHVYIEKSLKFLWFFCQPFLFALIGSEVRLSSLNRNIVASCVLCVIVSITIECITATFVTWGANLNWKEKLFVGISWLPKATVQAAIGPIALDLAMAQSDDEYKVFAKIVLNIAVLSILVTAPLGALLIAVTGPRLLNRDIADAEDDINNISVAIENDSNTVQ